ncbi:MAG: NUDIX hydrolase [Spirochaetaceae bacterium]|jgi:8-oxo-dGTP pyrophosphatase MutT (NUDIX family)|nr:NUDIX hydrolase [Spirochaetaceae bacterium]
MHNEFHSNERLIWKEEGRRKVFSCPIFSIQERICRSPDNDLRTFTVLDAPDWAIVVPVLETEAGRKFIMVRQWRHGSQELSLEFPGGVFEPGESAESAALRELQEETAYTAGSIRKLGDCSPNPAIMSNRVHFFLAENLKPLAGQNLDEDEYVDVELTPIEEAFHGIGKPPYIHALMGTALALFSQISPP